MDNETKAALLKTLVDTLKDEVTYGNYGFTKFAIRVDGISISIEVNAVPITKEG